MTRFSEYFAARENVTSMADTDTVIVRRASDGAIVEMAKTDLATEVGGGGGGAVDSVNGATGVVVLDADDIDDAATTNKFATAAQLAAVDGLGTLAAQDDIAVPADITATGTPSSSTYLRGDGTWATVTSSPMSDPGYILLDDMAGANDDAKFGTALTTAAAADPIPWIMLPARTVTLSTPRTPFTGMKICGPSGLSGMQNYQVASGATVVCDVNLTGSITTGTSSLFYSTGTIYDINIQGLTFRSNNTAQFWHQPSGTLYACTFRDLMFYGMRSAFGTEASPCLVTFCHFEGDWTVSAGSTGDTVFHFGGSDSTFWKNGVCNLQNGNSPTAKDNYQIIFTNMSKSTVGHLFVTSTGGWRSMLCTGSSGEGLTFEGSIFEGYSGAGDPGHACMVRIENGHVQMNNVYVSHAMSAPTFYGGTASGVIEITGGEVAINGGYYRRGAATASYGGVGAVPETVPWVYISGGTVAIRDVMGASTWTGVPRVQVAGGTLRDWDNSIVDENGDPFPKPGWGMVNHGATAGTARPGEFEHYIWYGSVQPTNMTGQDIVIRTDEAV